MFNFLKKIWAAAKSADKKTIAGILALSAVLFFAPNISNAALIDIGYTLIAKVAFGISWVIALLGGLIVGVIIIALQMILTVSNGIVNSSPVQIGFPIVLSVANLGFVTAIIFIAIGTILRSQTYNMKKMLANVVIMAVLVNFGLVISGAIIGFSNRVTTYFLDSMTGGNVADFATIMAQTMNPQQAFPDMKAPSITGTKVDAATTTIPKEDTDALAALGKNASNDDTKSIGSFLIPIISIFLTIATLVLMIVTLATLVFSFIMRYIKLTFALILLPGAWMASVFPSLKKWNSKWWDLFIKQAIYPPVVLFFLWLAMRVQADMAALPGLNFEDLSKMKGVSGFLGNLVGVPLQGVLQSAVLAGLMLGGDYIANSMGAAGAGAALKASGDMQKWAGGKVKRAGQRVGTRALGSGVVQGAAGGIGTLGAKMSNLGLSGKGGAVRQLLGKAAAPVRGLGRLAVVGQAGIKGQEKGLAESAGKSYRDEFSKMGDDELLIRAKAAKGLERAAILEKASKDPKLMAKLMNIPGFKDGVNKDILAEKDLYTRYGFKDAREGALVQSGFALSQASEYESLGLEKQRDEAKEKGDEAKVNELEEKIKGEKAKREFTNTKDVVSKMSKETIASFLSPDSKNLPAGMEIGGEELKNAQNAIVSGILKGSVSKFTSVIQELESKDKLKDFVSAVDNSKITEAEIGKGYRNAIEKGALAGITSYEELFKPAIEKGPKPSEWKGMSREQITNKIRRDNPSMSDRDILEKVNKAEEEAGK